MVVQSKQHAVHHNPDSGYFAITFCAPDRIQCSNCPEMVLHAIKTRILAVRSDLRPQVPVAIASDKKATKAMNAFVTSTLVQTTVTEFAVGGFPFMTEPPENGKNFASILALNILEELADLKYDLVSTTNLTSGLGISATWVFVDVKKHWKATQRIPPDTHPRLVLIEPSGYDRIRIVRSDPDIVNAVEQAVGTAWKYGLTDTTECTYGTTRITSMRLNNFPWYTHRSETNPVLGESKSLLLEIIAQMASAHYVLVCATNVYGQKDALIFALDDAPAAGTFRMISLDTSNCVRLINCAPPQVEAVRRMGKRVMEHGSAGHYELAIDDLPWIDMPMKSAQFARQMVKNIIEEMAKCGCYLLESLDVSRHEQDRSTLLFHQSDSNDAIDCACMALTYHNALTLMGAEATDTFADVYHPGVTRSSAESILLDGFPWTAMGESDRLHATAALLATIERMQHDSWEVLASIDVAGRNAADTIENGPHSLFFMKTT